jgi:peroxin-19
LSQNKDKLSKEDYEKYQLQYSYIQQIVEHFESQNNGEEATSTDPKIIDLMEKMQACGQPPQALLEELAPDMKFDQDGIPQPEQCTIM